MVGLKRANWLWDNKGTYVVLLGRQNVQQALARVTITVMANSTVTHVNEGMSEKQNENEGGRTLCSPE